MRACLWVLFCWTSFSVVADPGESLSIDKAKVPNDKTVLVQNDDRVRFGDIATSMGSQLYVRVNKISKSTMIPGYLEVPFPNASFASKALGLEHLTIEKATPIELKIIAPCKASDVRTRLLNMGLAIKVSGSVATIQKHDLVTPSEITKAISRIFNVPLERLKPPVDSADGFIHINLMDGSFDKNQIESGFLRMAREDFVDTTAIDHQDQTEPELMDIKGLHAVMRCQDS
ncbi:MAG TPA: hypothetical protein VEL47_06440 [Myxococcota bacterium]|nr:hypothetical protein [Myxococcota bacterium]